MEEKKNHKQLLATLSPPFYVSPLEPNLIRGGKRDCECVCVTVSVYVSDVNLSFLVKNNFCFPYFPSSECH